jgi:hypothetical protein
MALCSFVLPFPPETLSGSVFAGARLIASLYLVGRLVPIAKTKVSEFVEYFGRSRTTSARHTFSFLSPVVVTGSALVCLSSVLVERRSGDSQFVDDSLGSYDVAMAPYEVETPCPQAGSSPRVGDRAFDDKLAGLLIRGDMTEVDMLVLSRRLSSMKDDLEDELDECSRGLSYFQTLPQERKPFEAGLRNSIGSFIERHRARVQQALDDILLMESKVDDALATLYRTEEYAGGDPSAADDPSVRAAQPGSENEP